MRQNHPHLVKSDHDVSTIPPKVCQPTCLQPCSTEVRTFSKAYAPAPTGELEHQDLITSTSFPPKKKWAYWKQRPVQQQARACSKSPTLLVHSHNLKNPFIKKSLRSVSLQDRTYKMRCTKSFDQATVTNVSLELLWVFPVNWTTFPNAPVHLEAYLSKMRGRQLELLQFQSLIKQTFGRI